MDASDSEAMGSETKSGDFDAREVAGVGNPGDGSPGKGTESIELEKGVEGARREMRMRMRMRRGLSSEEEDWEWRK